MRRILLIIAAVVLFLGSCGGGSDLPEDDDLELFIQVSARCAYLERAYSDREWIMKQEIEEIDLSSDWKAMVDSLLVRYGASPDFWEKVFAEISAGSRRLPAEETGDIE
jgi:hypothetical protein